ncbi:MAG: hypothetical protein WD011_07395 [Nitriliruptoraceae bacterium]
MFRSEPTSMPLDVLVAITLEVAILGLQLAMTVSLYRSSRSDDR